MVKRDVTLASNLSLFGMYLVNKITLLHKLINSFIWAHCTRRVELSPSRFLFYFTVARGKEMTYTGRNIRNFVDNKLPYLLFEKACYESAENEDTCKNMKEKFKCFIIL